MNDTQDQAEAENQRMRRSLSDIYRAVLTAVRDVDAIEAAALGQPGETGRLREELKNASDTTVILFAAVGVLTGALRRIADGRGNAILVAEQALKDTDGVKRLEAEMTALRAERDEACRGVAEMSAAFDPDRPGLPLDRVEHWRMFAASHPDGGDGDAVTLADVIAERDAACDAQDRQRRQLANIRAVLLQGGQDADAVRREAIRLLGDGDEAMAGSRIMDLLTAVDKAIAERDEARAVVGEFEAFAKRETVPFAPVVAGLHDRVWTAGRAVGERDEILAVIRDIRTHIADAELEVDDELQASWWERAGIEASCSPKCPEGCGCRLGTGDADARECGCDGPCRTDGADQ